ncbi:hypothetical protein MESS4_340079 [Mesorhizobium sp. STM 4661]|nr:hypothetical protein MESS4_340079 [Mesorhizobium sp. STM 4661]
MEMRPVDAAHSAYWGESAARDEDVCFGLLEILWQRAPIACGDCRRLSRVSAIPAIALCSGAGGRDRRSSLVVRRNGATTAGIQRPVNILPASRRMSDASQNC